MDKVDYLLYAFYGERSFSEEGKKLLRKVAIIPVCIVILFILMFIYPTWAVYYLSCILFSDIGLFLIYFVIEGRIGTKKMIKSVNERKRTRFQEEQARLIRCMNEQGLKAQSVYNILKDRRKRFGNKKEGYFLTVVLPIIISGTSVLLKPLESSGEAMWTQYIVFTIALMVTFSEIGWGVNRVVGAINTPIKRWYWQKYEGERVLEYLEDMLYL